MWRAHFVILLGFLVVPPGLAQEVQEPPPIDGARSMERLRALSPALESSSARLERLRESLAGASTELEAAEIEAEIDEQRAQVEQLREDFRSLAAGVEENRYLGKAEKENSWDESLRDIIDPISRGMRELTAGPREMDELRDELEKWQERKDLSEAAVARIDELQSLAESDRIEAELEGARQLWSDRLIVADSQVQVFSQQIEERERSSPGMLESVSGFFADFWRSRGLNLLLAVVLMVLVFVLVRRGYKQFRRVSPAHRKGGKGFGARAADLAAFFLAALLALLTAVLVFYLRGDWLLLALAIVVLLAIAWASKTAVPPYLEQIRLILNVGPVRQDERLILNGIPWRVDKLAFYCEFRNPDLEGGLLRLPVRDVMPLSSRPTGPKEPWFPTRENDWVVLGDGTFGKVVHQTPEQVVVLRLGGSRKTYPTADFLTATPENLSTGFRICVIFGIDYLHQDICTTEVPEIFKDALEQTLNEAVERENLRSVKVEFASAGSSSLDYEILADFDGAVASRRNVLERLIQKVCVDVCNERGWVIPFTQVTIHQAAVGGEASEKSPAG